MARNSDIIELENGGGASAPCRIVLDPRTQRFLERAEDKALLSKPTNCAGDEYSLCHLTLAPLVGALGRLFPDIDVWDDPDELCDAINALADDDIRETPDCDEVMACIAENRKALLTALLAALNDPACATEKDALCALILASGGTAPAATEN